MNSPDWEQMFADIIETPKETINANELGALGAAMTATVAAGIYPDLTQAAAAMTALAHVYEPNAGVSGLYGAKYERYLAVDKALTTYWNAFTPN